MKALLFRNNKFWLFLIIVFGISLKLYKIGSPVLDLYPVRQEQCAMLARNFFRNGLNIFNGQVDWFATFNPHWALEFPLISYLCAIFYKFFGIRESIGRLIAVFFSACSIGVFYLLVKDLFDKRTGILSSLVLTIIPLNLYLSRVFMPEPVMLFFSIALLWSFNRWLDNAGKFYYLIAVFFGIFTFLSKIPTLSLLPVMGYLAYLRWGKRFFIKPSLIIFIILTILPTLFWYSKSNDNFLRVFLSGLLNTGMLTSPRFYLRMFQAFGVFIFTPVGILPFMLGFFIKVENRKQAVFHLWFIVLVLFLLCTAQRNFIHYSYQIPFMPTAAFFIARGFLLMNSPGFWRKTFLSRFNAKVITYVILILMFLSSWLIIQPCYKYNRDVYELGLKMQRLTAPDSLVIAGRCTGQGPLYYCDRKGWEINEEGNLSYSYLYQGKDLPDFKNELDLVNYLIGRGADYYMACDLDSFRQNDELVRYLNDNFGIFLASDKYIVFDLKNRKPNGH